jgi:hypothetical protein
MSPVDWLDVEGWGGHVTIAAGSGPASVKHEDDGGDS